MREKIVKILIDVAVDLNEQLSDKIEVSKGEEAALFGNNGVLDSLSLVNMIVQVENEIEDNFDVPIVLAEEKAMSDENGPFSTIGNLADYIDGILAQKK